MYSIASDFLDGYIARKFNQGTLLGEILDQVIDSIVVATFLILAVYLHYLPFITSTIYILREFWVYGIRRYAATFSIRIHSNYFGRLGCFFTSIGLWTLMLSALKQLPDLYSSFATNLGGAAVGLGLALSAISASLYTMQLIKELQEVKN
jgi:CDP-diacylglycerol--glycerol-3-phosphate 3-phosphatidyltransferase